MARKIKIGPVESGNPIRIPPALGPHCRATSVAKATSEGAKVILRSKSVIQGTKVWIEGRMPVAETWTIASVIGSLNRRGPALLHRYIPPLGLQ